IDDITFEESDDAEALPLRAIHGTHEERFGEVYIFSGFLDDGEPHEITLYENADAGEPASNAQRYPLERKGQ
ncbi:MAG: hypothetical protein ACRECY_13210, partial [Phyllobacterium sp.]